MLMIPKDKPVVRNLSSYYLDIGRLIEHYQAEIGTGAIQLKSPAAMGIVFFDEADILNVIYQDPTTLLDGETARDRLIGALESIPFSVSVYRIDTDRLFFWANLNRAEDYYQNLSSEFTDLDGLIKKMTSLRLTGYVKASLTGKPHNGLVFFMDGNIIDTSCSWDPEGRRGSSENLDQLIRHAKAGGGTFHVRRLDLNNIGVNGDKKNKNRQISAELLDMIHQLLLIFDHLVSARKEIRVDFDTLLRKKFIQKADMFEFLDPFADEFTYTPESLRFTGNASPEQLVAGIEASVGELARDLEVSDDLHHRLDAWRKTYADSINAFGIEL